MSIRKTLCLLSVLLLPVFTVQAQLQLPAQNPASAPSFRNPVKDIKVVDIKVEGNKTIDKSLIIASLQVQKAESYLPPVLKQKVQASVTALNKMNLFSDIAVDIQYPDSVEGVSLTFTVKELPTLAKVELLGLKKVKDDDIKAVMDLLDGQVYSRSAVEKNRQKIIELYQGKGYLLCIVNVTEKEEADTGRKIVTFNIEEGKKVVVRYITFSGNTSMLPKNLRKTMKTKEERWWRSGDFKEEDFRTSLDTLVDFYKEHGYLDANVIDHKITYTEDKKEMDIHVNVHEGRQFHFGKAYFVHNNILPDAALKAQVLLDSGEVLNIRKFEAMKFGVQSAYREEGYLFVDLQDQFTYRDSIVDVTFNIKENSIAHINKVNIRGNTKTKDKVIRREVRLFPGDIFRQSLVMRSQRDIMQLNFFDNVEPNVEPVKDGDASDVDLVVKVSEKSAGTGTFSAGAAYSQRDNFVGTLGMQIPNLMGNGQRFDASVEYGTRKQLYSLGLTEPWFLDTPTSIGGTIFYNYQEALLSSENNYERKGISFNLGRRLTWPDDYFSIRGRYNLTLNSNGQSRNSDYLIVPSGLESSISATVVRDDKNLPVFPSEGSRYSFTYTKVGGGLGGNFDYAQYETKINWWFPTVGKFVLGVENEFGLITGENVQSYALYQMGGLLGYQGKMRGYSPGSIGSGRIGRSYFSFVTELSYPVVENTFYIMGFYDVGNVFGNLTKYEGGVYGPFNTIGKKDAPNPISEIDLSDLKRDLGFGFRLVVPLVGIMGFDFGWGLDNTEAYESGESRPPAGDMKVNFVVEQGF